ncbi:hypothetical protein PVAG01_00901 [Phlyctema vagabunda]|uniref:CCHC-type domain-containing protein n=1 Tax=Phlyctema vagabunda TaxID=108571 RepID=A0ABR4PVK1_9HELO
MATSWSQSGQYAGSNHYDAAAGQGQTAQGYERPPVCFTCGEEGHFVVNCPKSANRSSAGLSTAPAHGRPQHSTDPSYAPQSTQYTNQSYGATVPRYSPPHHNASHHPHYDHAASGPPSHGQAASPTPAPVQQYQQYLPQPQRYPQQVPQVTYQQQYNGPPQAYNQAYPQAEPPSQQYGYPGYQGPPQSYAQFSQSTAQPQYSPPYQAAPSQYPSAPGPYAPQPEPYPTQPNGYEQQYNYAPPPGPPQQAPPQWAPPPVVPSYSVPPYHHPPQPPNYSGQYGPPDQGHYPQAQAPPAYDENGYSYQQYPQDTNYIYPPHQQEQSYGYQSTATSQDYIQPRSRSSSIASVPYASTNFQGTQGQITSVRNEYTEDTGGQSIAQQSPEDQQFNWEFKKAFTCDAQQPPTLTKRPFPTIFEDDTSPLFRSHSTDTVSRYVSKTHQKEFKQNIRSTHHWNSIQRDPVFSEWSDEENFISIDQLSTWNDTVHRKSSQRVILGLSSSPSRKRGREAGHDELRLPNQISPPLDYNNSTQVKRHKINHEPPPVENGDERHGTPTLRPGTPVLTRLGSPSVEPVDDAWAPQAGESVDPTEAKLAALGVSGAPKPVEPMDPVPFPENFHRQYKSQNSPQRQDSGYISSRGSYSNGSEANLQTGNGNQGQGQWHTPPPPPPPPPPPLSIHRRVDETNATPTSIDKQSQYMVAEQILMPSDSSPIPALSDAKSKEPQPRRKIVRVISGKKSEPQRQADDVTPKFKRSQPVVAEAYR